MRLFQLLGCLVVGLAACTSAQAAPITYIYSGTGTGTLDGATFTNAAFTITGAADTVNIAPWPISTNPPLRNPHLSTQIEIDGLGIFSITTPVHSWVSAGANGFGGLGEDLADNWLTLQEPVLVGYGLDGAIGPVVETTPTLFSGQFIGVATSGGELAFTSVGTVSFTAVPVPEPASVAFAAIGLVLLASQRRLVARA